MVDSSDLAAAFCSLDSTRRQEASAADSVDEHDYRGYRFPYEIIPHGVYQGEKYSLTRER